MAVVKPFPLEKEFEKNPDITPEDLRKLREWVDTQPHLPGKYLTDMDMMVVYHCCERSMEVSKQVLDLHFSLRTLFTTYFKDRCFDKKAEFSLDTVLFAALPTPTVNNYRAIYARLIDYDPKNFYFTDCIRTFMMMFDLWQLEEGTWPGFVILIDLDQCLLGHVARLELMAIRQVLYFLQECMFVKLKGVHFINAPYFMDKIMMLLKPFMKKALLDIIHIHQPGSKELFHHVPLDAFPKEFGGKYKDHNTIKEDLIKRLKANTEFLRDENRRRVVESQRPNGNKCTVEDIFGIQGSFKKLDID